ncbi:hypothetical protein B296_00034191 [Ensete ventricosum]|uniref:SPRY domain-containing protein n=1 Tax=Ensete ventricosum TaxID=4639 RepID=A0A427A015_ENSVE|nr:hypothetical protein B296_00034191 [Ensete ventricosum]
MADTPPDQQHVCRVGISRASDPVGNLGETTNSFGFGGTGKFSSSGKFSDYGTKFGVSDTIICAVDLDSKPLASIGFSKNGKWLGVARHFDASSRGLGVVELSHQGLPWESALFPHILLKNVVVQLQFSIEDGLVPEEGYKPWASALQDANAVIGPTFTSPSQCEVIMMVGLPASGKTTWAEKWINEHPGKRYVLLGASVNLSASHPSLSVPCRDSSSTFQIRLGYTGLPMQSDSAYRDYSKYGVTSCHGTDPSPYGSYAGSNFSTRNAYDRSSTPYGDMSLYQTYNTADAFRRPSFDSLGSSGKVINYENPLTPTLYRSPVGQLDPGFPHIHHPAARGPPYEWRSPAQSTHGRRWYLEFF